MAIESANGASIKEEFFNRIRPIRTVVFGAVISCSEPTLPIYRDGGNDRFCGGYVFHSPTVEIDGENDHEYLQSDNCKHCDEPCGA